MVLSILAWRQKNDFWRQKFRNMNLKSNIRRFETCPESGRPRCPKTYMIGGVFFRMSSCFLKKDAKDVPWGDIYGTFFKKTGTHTKKCPDNRVRFGASRPTTFGTRFETSNIRFQVHISKLLTSEYVSLASGRKCQKRTLDAAECTRGG